MVSLTSSSLSNPLLACTSSLPVILDLEKIVESRAHEIRRLAEELQLPKNKNKRSFQYLPKRERRRVQSHNPYRIPRRYRNGILKEFENAPPKVSRRLRKDRRQSPSLLHVFSKRFKKNKWLHDTHVWHAKRFHMKNQWNYRLPMTACEKQQRRMYRYCIRRCTIHDRSYMSIFELSGIESSLEELLGLLGAQSDILMHPQMKFGGYSIPLLLYRCDYRKMDTLNIYESPLKKLIGPCECIWHPIMTVDSSFSSQHDQRKLWLLSHPSCANELYVNLLKGLQILKTTHFIKLTKKQGCSQFELSGRESLQYLCETLLPIHLLPEGTTGIWKTLWDSIKLLSKGNPPIQSGAIIPLFIKRPILLGPFPPRPRQLPTISLDLLNTNNIPSLLIHWPTISLAEHTRFFLNSCDHPSDPLTHIKIVTRSRKRKHASSIVTRLKHIQEKLRQSKQSHSITTNPLCTHHAKQPLLKPAHYPHLHKPAAVSLDHSDFIPILIIKRNHPIMDSSGYDGYNLLIPPQSGGHILWNLLTRRGCCPIGVMDRHHLLTDGGIPDFPYDFPETHAGMIQQRATASELYAHHLKRPPSKRINYAALGIPYPFLPSWFNASSSCLSYGPIRDYFENPLLSDNLYHFTTAVSILRPISTGLFHTHPFQWIDITLPWSYNYIVECIIHGTSSLDTSEQVLSLHDSNKTYYSWTILQIISLLILSTLQYRLPLNHQPLCVTEMIDLPMILNELQQRAPVTFIAVNVYVQTRGVPKQRSHLYSMNSLEMKDIVTTALADLHEGTQFLHYWRLSHKRSNHTYLLKSRPTIQESIIRQYKTSKKKKKFLEQSDQFHQLGHYNIQHSNKNLCGFITSGHQTLRHGKGFGIGSIDLINIIQSLYTFLNIMREQDAFSNEHVLNKHVFGSIFKHQILDVSELNTICIPYWFRNVTSLVKEPCWVSLQI